MLGLSSGWLEWTSHSSGGQFSGTNAVAAYNSDNAASLSALNEVSATNHHWQDGAYQSFIFPSASPNYAGTVGANTLQDLLMEPTANSTPSVTRFELTNVDVGALVDVGWSVVSGSLDGDFNNNGAVDAADYVVWRKSIGTPQAYTLWRSNFGAPGSGSALAGPSQTNVPEPTTFCLLAFAVLAFWERRGESARRMNQQ